MRKRAEDEKLMLDKMHSQQYQESQSKGAAPAASPAHNQQSVTGNHPAGGQGHRNWMQRVKDDLVGTKEEREAAKKNQREAEAAQKKQIKVRGSMPHSIPRR